MTGVPAGPAPGNPVPATPPPDDHMCHARACKTPVPPRMFMCRPHWFSLPKMHQDAIWATYRPGQERTKNPSPEYLAAATTAVNYLAEREDPKRGEVK